MSLATSSCNMRLLTIIILLHLFPLKHRAVLDITLAVPHKSTNPDYPLNVYVRADSSTALGVMGYVIRYYPVDNSNDTSARTFGYNTE